MNRLKTNVVFRGICLTAVVSLMTLSIGCGGGKFAEVTGTVTMDGEPLANAEVTFMPDEGGGASFGMTDSSGKYSLIHSGGDRGALPGRHTVSIQIAETEEDYDAEGMDEGTMEEDQSAEGTAIPARYNEETELTAEVTKAGEPIDFPLTSEE